MKASATVSDVEAVRVTFALEAEEWFVEQFAQCNHGKSYLERYLGRELAEHLLTGEERERLEKHLKEVRKVKGGGGGSTARLDGKPRRRADGQFVWPDGSITPTDQPLPPVAPRGRPHIGRGD